MYSKIIDFFSNLRSTEFDPEFYKKYYKDLAEINGARKLQNHYMMHGKKEGRFPNAVAAAQGIAKLEQAHPNFNIVAYKYYNPDLIRELNKDDDFILHYSLHGKVEGRKCAFDIDGQDAVGIDAGKHDDSPSSYAPGPTGEHASKNMWEGIFSVAQAMAWFGDALPTVPASKRAVIEAFREHGIDNLWPIELSFIFDPVFYRTVVGVANADNLSESQLYRHWLEDGLPNGLAPNPQAYLYAYLGGAPFPEDFDWDGYSRLSSNLQNKTKFDIVKQLFESPSLKPIDVRPYFRDNYIIFMIFMGKHALSQGNYTKSVTAFSEVISLSPSSGVFCLLGDAYLRSGRSADALEAYKRSIKLIDASIWSYFNAIDILIDRTDFIGAFAIIVEAHQAWSHKTEFYIKLSYCIDRYFQNESARAHRIIREVNMDDRECILRGASERILEIALDRIKSLFLKCDNVPAKRNVIENGYISFLANDDLKQCTHYRIEQKLLQFAAGGVPIKFFSHRETDKFLDSLIGARAALFYRVAAVPDILRCIVHAKAMGLPTFYEIDDLIFDPLLYPDAFDTFEGQISREEYNGLQFGVPLFRYAMSECDSVIASTPALARQMLSAANKQSAIVVRNGLDQRNEVAIQHGVRPSVRTDGRVRIFYGSGTKAHNADFNQLVGPALAEIMARYGDVELVIVGHLKLSSELQAFDDRLRIYPFISDLNAYWSLLASCDINLAVLHLGVIADCKSEIKWLEAAILQIPSVVAATATYREVIESGVDGLLAATPDDWRQHIEMLVIDAGMRRRVGAAARKKALDDYSLERAAAIWQAAFLPGSSVPKSSSPAVKRKMRVMVCNVFFHPQSIGGATRVVEANIRALTELYDDIELAVFCSNEGATNLGCLRTGHFGDVPVYRIATPMEEDMDWRPFNDANQAHFTAALDAFRPDVIHFHCIQRLTASIVEVALARRIPYIVTLHDGWWISDNQFLVDRDGFLKLPTADVMADCENSKRPLPSIERRQRLRALLQAADARLSVSAPFAKIYADAGIQDITVVENGVPALTPSPRQPRTDGRVALGHIGGRAAHKGAYLIEAALRQGNYRNLHLTMVDGTLASGEAVQTTWGGTPVTLCGPYPQAKITDLYAQLDVLLAPSTWPESYGLVTREALSLGLWVVASNLGAIGQGVTQGQDGYVIDTATAKELKEILTLINSDSAKYKSSTINKLFITRSLSDQAKDIHKVYLEIANRQAISILN